MDGASNHNMKILKFMLLKFENNELDFQLSQINGTL
jgi:hypothetical protein